MMMVNRSKPSSETGQRVLNEGQDLSDKTGKRTFLKGKEDINQDVDQETQLVKIENEGTLEGKVNMKKVRDIRRAIRRRYASRKNPAKIFSAWDQKKKGLVDLDDVISMITKLGININKDEARVLLISADGNGDNCLDLEEFHEMIFTNNEALNVDLSKLPVDSNDEVAKSMMANLTETIKVKKEQRENSLLKLFVQK